MNHLPLACFLFQVALFADPPPGCYDSAPGKSGADLGAALHQIMRNHHPLSYSGTPHPNTADALGVLDQDPADTNNAEWRIQTDWSGTESRVEFTSLSIRLTSIPLEMLTTLLARWAINGWSGQSTPVSVESPLTLPLPGFDGASVSLLGLRLQPSLRVDTVHVTPLSGGDLRGRDCDLAARAFEEHSRM